METNTSPNPRQPAADAEKEMAKERKGGFQKLDTRDKGQEHAAVFTGEPSGIICTRS